MFSIPLVNAQNYYYNNFDTGQMGAAITQTTTNASLELSTNSPLVGTHSLSSMGNGKAAAYKFSFVDNGLSMNTDVEKNGWDWTFIYRNSGGNTDDSKTIDDNENAWRYWLYASNTDLTDMRGYFLTQVGTVIHIFVRNGQYDVRSVISYDLAQLGGNNITYAVRIQRVNLNGNTFRVFIDPYTISKREATTLRMQSNSGDFNKYTNYNYSGLQLSSTTAGRFKFDEFKMYSRKLEITAINDPANGFSNPLYNGQKDAVIYALKFRTRGLFDEVYQLQLDIEQSIGQYSFADIIENPRLYRSTDDYLGNSDDILIYKNQTNGSFAPTIGNRTLQANDFATQIFQSVGTPEGSLVDAGSLFFKADIKLDASNKGTFAIKKLARIGNYTTGVDYVNQTGVVQGNTSTVPAAAAKIYDWVGTDATWTTLSNWKHPDNNQPTTLPGVNDLVRIGVRTGFAKSPTILADVKIGSLLIGGSNGVNPSINIASGKKLTITTSFSNERASAILGSGSLEIEGSWLTSGGNIDLLSENITLKFTGTKAQSITDKSINPNNGVLFGNVLFSGSTKTLSATGKFALAVGKYLTLDANTILQTSNNLTLKASALGSASVATIPSSSSVQGKVIVEKYIQGGGKNTWRTYRMLSSPIYDNSANFTSQDVSGNRTYSFTQFIDDIIIGGKGGASNGFDVTPTNPATAWTYNKGFKEIENINTSINVGYGAYLFFCGNRNNITAKVTPPFVDAESIVMTFEGVLNQQKVTVPLTGANLVGNPYAATIDWNSVSKSSNVSSIIRVWNPSNRQYSTYNGEFEINGGSKYLGPGQAFFVQTTDGAPGVVTFTEAAKVSNTSQAAALYNVVMTAPVKEEKSIVTNLGKLGVATSGNVYSNSTLSQPSKIRIKLLREGTENSDETLVVLKNNELATVSGNDVTKMNGETVFLSSLSQEGRLMAINYMPHVSVISSIKLDVKADNSGAYKLMCTSEDIPFGYEAKLNDKYLNSITNLEAENTIYSFAIDKTVAASYGSNRFEILFNPVTTLPVNVSEFTGSRNNEGVLLKWTTSLEENNSYFEVFRAGDKQQYASVGIVEANKSGAYSILDKAPLNGNNYYSLVQVDKDGKSTPYPQLVTVKYGLNVKASNELLVYPTIVESNFTLKYSGANASNRLIVKISDLTGKNIFHKEVGKNELLNGYSASFPATSSGAYFVSLIDAASKKNIASAKLFKK